MEAVSRVIDALTARGSKVRKTRKGWEAQCPAHDDRNPSLLVSEGADGRALVHCLAGCDAGAIARALGLELRDLFDEPAGRRRTGSRATRRTAKAPTAERPKTVATWQEALPRSLGKPSRVWEYREADGRLVGIVARWDRADGGKDIRPAAAAGGGWLAQAMPEPRPLYDLPAVRAAETVFVCEGEKAADAIRSLGLTATTSPGGALAAGKADWSPVAGRRVVIVPDRDEPGEGYARDVARLAAEAGAASVSIVRLADHWEACPVGGDAADWVATFGDAAEPSDIRAALEAIIATAEPVAAETITESRPNGSEWRSRESHEHGGGADLSKPSTLTDTGLGRRLAKMLRGRLAYVRERKTWVHWDGTRWADNGDHVAELEAKRMHDELWSELGELSHEDKARVVKFVLSSGNQDRIKAAVGMAKSEHGINVSMLDFDTHPMLLNVRNGVIDLRSGDLRPHDPKLRITQLAAVEYVPEAKSELWERFIRDVTCGDDELADFLQQAFGIALTGDVSDEVLICHKGDGCNGKSTCLEAVSRMLGDYAAVAPPGMFSAKNFEPHPTEVASIWKKRLVTSVEQDAGRALRESLIKTLTGGETIRTRRMHEDFWEMLPTWHIHLAYNREPRLNSTDGGMERRLRTVPWDASFKGDPDLTIKERLVGEAERSGILNWCLDGLRKRLAAGRLPQPEAVKTATDEYLAREDLMGQFLDDCTEKAGPSALVRIEEVIPVYKTWLKSQGVPQRTIEAVSPRTVSHDLGLKGVRTCRPDSGEHRKKTVAVGVRLVIRDGDAVGAGGRDFDAWQ